MWKKFQKILKKIVQVGPFFCSTLYVFSKVMYFHSTAQILANVEVAGNNKNARKYYEGSVVFMNSLTKILEALTFRVSELAAEDIRNANISQIYGIFLLAFVMLLSPILLVLAKNGITSIQVRYHTCTINHRGFYSKSPFCP